MAFRGHELNLMLRVQDRASSRLRKLSGDLAGVGNAADASNAANRQQQALQSRRISQAKQLEALQRKIQTTGRSLVSNITLFNAQEARNAEAFLRRRNDLIRREDVLRGGIARKEQTINATRDKISRLSEGGSGALRQGIAASSLIGQGKSLAVERANLLDKELKISQDIHASTARRLLLENKMGQAKITNLSTANLESVALSKSGVKVKAAAKQLLANRIEMERLLATQALMPKLVDRWSQKLSMVGEKEQLILAQIDEQALSLRRLPGVLV